MPTATALRVNVTVIDRDSGTTVESATGVTPPNADHFIQTVYRDNPGRSLTARVELDLDDTCLEW